jgi:hypothetical protein
MDSLPIPNSTTDVATIPAGRSSDRRAAWLTLAGALAAAGLLRAARGYRSFPSIDDFAYLPMALARLHAELYPRDLLLRETPLHVPLLPSLVAVLQATTGLELGFWLITIALSLLTLLAMYRWMRALGVPGALLPIAAILVCAGSVDGLGRGEYDGVFGDAFHFQWASLCALLWAYDALLRGRLLRAGALLAGSLVLHPVVGTHGVVAVVCALVFARASLARRRLWLVPVAVAACTLLGAAIAFVLNGLAAGPISELPELVQALLFRLPHEYEIDPLKATLFLVLVAAGFAAMDVLARQAPESPVGTLFGLQAGHLLLFAAGCLLYEIRTIPRWSTWTLLPFQLSLFRTTPVLLSLSSVAAATALERGLLRPPSRDRSFRGISGLLTRGIQVGTVVCLAVFQVKWSWQVALCCGVAAFTALSIYRKIGYRTLTAAWLVALVGGFVLFARSAPLAAPTNNDQEQLFRWIRSNTPVDALFIIPPAFQEFRTYARRSAYVDFKTVTPGDPRLVAVWRQRLERVAAPDRLAREARGWSGAVEWERTYAVRNTPRRIRSLLLETGADYFVWDREGLRVPPFGVRDRTPDPTLTVVFVNDRYEVYRLLGPRKF